MTLRSLFLLVPMLTGCDADCSLPAGVDEIIDGAPVRRCGDLPPQTGGRVPYDESRDCVIAALADKAPFEVRWEIGDEAHALIGIWSGGYQLRKVDASEARSTTYECSAITDLGACGDIFTNLCFECADAAKTDSCE
jgi:hypothetical protein